MKNRVQYKTDAMKAYRTLRDFNGNVFYKISDAIDYIRKINLKNTSLKLKINEYIIESWDNF